MANQEQLDILMQGVLAWDQWRKKHPNIIPNLINVELSGAYLQLVDLSNATLNSAILSNATLNSAILNGADLSGANLYSALQLHLLSQQ